MVVALAPEGRLLRRSASGYRSLRNGLGVQPVSDATCVRSLFLRTGVKIEAYRDNPGTLQ